MPNSVNFNKLAAAANDLCPICQNDFSSDADAIGHITKEKVNHIFHRTCVIHWIEQHRDCPLCRIKVEHIEPGLFTRLKPYLLNGTVAATTAAAVGAGVMIDPRPSRATLLGLYAGFCALNPLENAGMEPEKEILPAGILMLLGTCALPLLLLAGEGSPEYRKEMFSWMLSTGTIIAGTAGRIFIELIRSKTSLRIDPEHVPDVQIGLAASLFMFTILADKNDDQRTEALLFLALTSCLATIALTAYRRFFDPDAA